MWNHVMKAHKDKSKQGICINYTVENTTTKYRFKPFPPADTFWLLQILRPKVLWPQCFQLYLTVKLSFMEIFQVLSLCFHCCRFAVWAKMLKALKWYSKRTFFYIYIFYLCQYIDSAFDVILHSKIRTYKNEKKKIQQISQFPQATIIQQQLWKHPRQKYRKTL